MAASAPLQAAPVTFFGEDLAPNPGVAGSLATVHPKSDAAKASFFANLTGGVDTQTFESYAANTPLPLTISFPGAGTATLTGSATSIQVGTSSSDQFPISGTKYLNADANFTLTFSTAIAAFGFYGTDIGDIGATLTLSLVDAGGIASTLTVPDLTGTTANGSTLYYGFYNTADTYKSVSFSGAGADVFGFDDFSIGSIAQVKPIPEPATLGLLGAGLMSIAIMRRRRGAF